MSVRVSRVMCAGEDHTMSTNELIAIVAGVLVVAVLAVWMYLNRRRAHLKARFGPEYERVVEETGSPRRAETLLESRQARVKKYQIHPLTPDEHLRFSKSWREVQGRFVDDPAAAVADADALVIDLMRTRGYPMSDFDRRAEDLSVDHPAVVSHYRAAHDVASRHAGGGVSTEELRQGLVHYRALFEDLLEVREPERRRA
jgi:hypothetical protein